jgi:cell division protein FtsB
MTDTSTQSVDQKLRALFATTKDVDEFVNVQKLAYALSAERDALAAEVEKLREALTVYSDKVSEYAHEEPAISDLAYDWLNEDGGRQARAALEEGND